MNKIKNEFNLITENFNNLIIKSESYVENIKEKEYVHHCLLQKINNSLQNSNNIIVLNIGGKIFNTNKQTLMSIKNTYFYGLMVNNEKFKLNPNGVYFIDRDPIVFDRILNFLRTGNLNINELTPYLITILNDDLDYYCLPIPLELQPINNINFLKWDNTRKSIHCTLSNNNLTVTKTSGTFTWNCIMVGNITVDKYTVRIDKTRFIGGILIGFSLLCDLNPNEDRFENGWFISVYDGKLYGIGIADTHDNDYSTKIKEGDFITVIREGTQIRFKNNNIDLGICYNFKNIPNQPLFPVVNMLLVRSSVSLVNDYN